MNSSLDKLVKNLNSEDFKYLSEVFSAAKLKLVKGNGVYPYEYFDIMAYLLVLAFLP